MPGCGAVRKFHYAPATSLRRFLLIAAGWYLILFTLDPRVLDFFNQNSPLHSPPYLLTFPIDVLYAVGLFWLIPAFLPMFTRGGIRIDHVHGTVFFYLHRLFERRRFRKKISDIEEVIYVEGVRGGIFLYGARSRFCCLRLSGPERGKAKQREYAIWLASWIGCSWCHLDRRGRIVAHLPCP